jgi:hypothetical protein
MENMNIDPTIPCPVCEAPILVKLVELPTGDIARVYAEPLSNDQEVFPIHKHQVGDVNERTLH